MTTSDLRSGTMTVATVLTPVGRGAIATIVVEGAGAPAAVERHFFSTRSSIKTTQSPRAAAHGLVRHEDTGNRLRFGWWGHELREEVVLRAGSDERYEIHCHGGTASVTAILESLEQSGCQILDWQTWLAEREPNRIRAEATKALARASTQNAAAVLLDQYHGALEEATQQLIQQLQKLVDGCQLTVTGELQQLLDRAPLGLHLADPWKVAIAGRPNVGKSTLLNALLGYARAITSERPGTTRDLVTAQTALGGWPVLLIDTAGLAGAAAGSYRPRDSLEEEGIKRARSLLQQADLRILVFDNSQPLIEEDRQLLAEWPDAICVANKLDLGRRSGFGVWESESGNRSSGIGRSEPRRRRRGSEITASQLQPDSRTPKPDTREVIGISAKTGEGIDRLVQAIAARLVPDVPPAGSAVPFTTRQVSHLELARAALTGYDFDRAIHELEAI